MSSRTIDLSECLDRLSRDITLQVPALAHIDCGRVLFTMTRSRASGSHGSYARISPLRPAGGRREFQRRRGRYHETFRMPALSHQGRDILYLITLFIPRFLRLPFEEKLATVIHELYHISEACDGDIRRFAGRNYAHGASRKAYNARITQLVEQYLASYPPEDLLEFLRLEEEQWLSQVFALTGLTTPLPRARLINRKPL